MKCEIIRSLQKLITVHMYLIMKMYLIKQTKKQELHMDIDCDRSMQD